MIPRAKYYSTDTPLLEDIYQQLIRIQTVGQLRACAERFLYRDVGDLICQALDYFAESKVKLDGRNDGKKIFEHLEKGYGPRIADESIITCDLCIALGAWVEHNSGDGVPLGKGRDCRARKSYGASCAKDLAYDVLTMLAERLAGRT